MQNKKNILFTLTVILVLQSCFLFRNDDDYVKQNKMAVQGIDISHHQGMINWDDVKTENISFIFMKATEGTTFTDPAFKNYLKQAKAMGKKVGAYHFFSFCKSGEDQADHFINVVAKNEKILPILDLEFDAESECGKTEKEVIKQVNGFITKIKEHYGCSPLLYMPAAFYKRYAIGEFEGCKLWIRDTEGKPNLPDKKEWHFWQYADRGKIKGINGYVDLNAFNGDEKAFNSFLDYVQ